MFKDIRIFLDEKRTDYKYDIIDGVIICSVVIESNAKNLDIFFDENIYEIILANNLDIKKLNVDKIRIDLKNIKSNIFTFKVILNYKYFIKTVYKYINNLIDKFKLLDELEIFKKSIIGKKYLKQINSLITKIDNKSIDELLLTSNKENERIENILLNDELYLFLENKMISKDLMLLITDNIYCERPPKITQEEFNDLVNAAINYDYALENVWRLGMNYDERGLKFDLLDDFFINSKDSYYLGEYISGIYQANQEKIVSKLIDNNDKTFIKQLLENDVIQDILDGKYKQLLINAINN